MKQQPHEKPRVTSAVVSKHFSGLRP